MYIITQNLMILPENKTLCGTNFLTKSHNCIRIITLGKFFFLWDSEEGFQTYSTFRIWTMICDLCLHKMRARGTVLSSVAKSIGVFERVVPYHSLWGWGLTNIGYGGLVLRLFVIY